MNEITTKEGEERLSYIAEKLINEQVKSKAINYFGLFALAGSLGIFSFLATLENRITASIENSLSDDTEEFRKDALIKLSDARAKAENASLAAQSSLARTEKIIRRLKKAETEIAKAEVISKEVFQSADSIAQFLLEDRKFKEAIISAVSISSGSLNNAIISFNSSSCPNGWSEMVSGRGRYIVGLNPEGELGKLIGAPLADSESRASGMHSHDFIYSAKDDGIGDYPSYGKGGHRMQSSRRTEENIGVAGTNAPYVQLLLCQKNV